MPNTSPYAPGIIHEDTFSQNGPIQGEDTPIAAFLGKTTWGPLNEPTLIESFSEFLRLFGTFRSDSDMAYCVRSFFANGGQKCYIVRQAHYSDVGAGTTSAAAATDDINDDTPDKIFSIDAKSPGDYGNDISYTVTGNPLTTTTLAANVSAGASSFRVASPTGIHAGQILSITDGSTIDYVKVLSITTAVVSGTPQHTVAITGTMDNGYSTSDDVVSLEFDIDIYYEDSADPVESWEQLSLESTLDNFVETVINDEETGSLYVTVNLDETNTRLAAGYAGAAPNLTYYPPDVTITALSGGVAVGTIDATDLAGSSVSGVGIHALDDIEDVRIVAAIPDSNQASYAAAFIYEGLDFCANRTNCFLLTSADQDSSVTTAITARNTNGFNNPKGAQSYNRIKVVDPLGTTRYISPLGGWAGRISFVDSETGGGPWNAAAGLAPRGNLVDALGVERSLSDAQIKSLNNAGMTAIISKRNEGVVIWGARTLASTDITFRYINTIRSLMYLKQSVSDGLGWAVFRNNDGALALGIKDACNDFLNEVWKAGGLKGDTPEEAYQVLSGEADGVQTPTDTANGRQVTEVRVALQRPAEFVIFRWSEEVGQA